MAENNNNEEDLQKLDDSTMTNEADAAVDEEAAKVLMDKPSPKLQNYLDKYESVGFEDADRNNVGGVKRMLEDYKSGTLKQKYVDISDDDIVSSIEEQESMSGNVNDSYLAKAMDIPVQIVGGFRDAAQSVANLVYAGVDKLGEQYGIAPNKDNNPQLPEVRKAKSVVGDITRGVSQFLGPFSYLNTLGKAGGVLNATSKLGKFAEASAVGAATDFLAFDEHQKRLSDLIEEYPKLKNPISGYLKSNPNDTVVEGRFKNALEGVGLGALTEGFFKAVKFIKNGTDVKSTFKEFSQQSDSRVKDMDRGYDDILEEIKKIPLRNKKSTTLEELAKTAEDVKWTKEDLLNGNALKELDSKSTQPLAIKATQLQEEAFNKVKEAIPDFRARIETGEGKAVDDYWNEMVKLHELDFVAKDIAAKHGGAEAMVFRRHNTAVEQANAMYKVFASADTLDKRKLVEAHMNILESKGNLDNFVEGITSSTGDKLKKVIKSLYMANILSSPVTHFKNIVSTSLNSLVYAPVEQAIGAGVGSARKAVGNAIYGKAADKISKGFFSNINDSVQYKEAWILFHSQISQWADAFKYLGNSIRGQTETMINASKKGEKLSRIKDITEASKRYRFDSGVAYDNIANTGFDAMSLGIEKEGLLQTGAYHAANLIGNYTKIPGSLIQTYDDLMKGMYFKAKVEAQTYRLASKEGLSGDALKSRWNGLYNMATYKPDLNAEMLSKPKWMRENKLFSKDEVVKNIQDDALDFASEYTYTKKLEGVGNSIQNLRDSIDKVMPLIPGGSIIMPFMKTPMNLMKFFTLDRGPLAPLTEAWRADFMAGGARADMAMSRLATGSTMFGIGAFLAANGYVTGNGPKNPSQKSLHRDLGIQERSVKIGDKYHDIGWLDPVASFLLYPANIVELSDRLDNDVDEEAQDKMERYAAAGILGMSNLFLNKSFTMGLSELMSAITDQDEKSFTRVIKSYTSSLVVPNAVTYVGQVMNPMMQDADSLLENIETKMGLNVRPRRDIFGREVVRNPKVNNLMYPISYSEFNNDPVVANMIASGAYVQKPKRIIENVKLNYDEYDKLMTYMKEQDVYGQIRKLVESPLFSQTPDTARSLDDEGNLDFTKKNLIQAVYRNNLDVAKKRVVSESPELKNKIVDFKLKSFMKPARTKNDTRVLTNLGVLNK